jgi:hypothetical protein
VSCAFSRAAQPAATAIPADSVHSANDRRPTKSILGHLSSYERERGKIPDLLLLSRTLQNARNYYYKDGLNIDKDLNDKFVECKLI